MAGLLLLIAAIMFIMSLAIGIPLISMDHWEYPREPRMVARLW